MFLLSQSIFFIFQLCSLVPASGLQRRQHIHEDYAALYESGDKTAMEYIRKLSRGLQSGFLKHHVIVSMTISYKGRGGQKCRGWLTRRYIFLRLA